MGATRKEVGAMKATTAKRNGMILVKTSAGMVPLGLAGLAIETRHSTMPCVECGAETALNELTESGHCETCATAGME
jgi:hypothetical protein